MTKTQLTTMAALCLSAMACTSSETTAPKPEPEPEPSEPVYSMPEVWGSPALEDMNEAADVVEVELRAEPTQWQLADGTTIDGQAYNGIVPGPLLQAKVGDEIIVHFTNLLDEPTTVHWHGLRISDQMDGSPRIQEPVQPGESFEYRFVAPEAGSFWYHPHVNTHLQVEKGLQGTVVIHGENDPVYDRERYLVIDDILVDAQGNLPPPLISHPEIMHGRSGNTLLTNGDIADTVRAQAQRNEIERWRIVNPANARTMKLSIEGATVWVIGTDGGLLPEPYPTNELIVPVGQRFDLEVRYDQASEVTIQSHVLTLDDNDQVIEVPFQVFAVDVAEGEVEPHGIAFPDLPPLPGRAPESKSLITLNAVEAPNSPTGVEWQINGNMEGPLFTFQQGQSIELEIKNELGPEHPFHLHGQFFEVLNDASQPGLKDTVLVPGLSTVNIVGYFDNPGRWMAHCHILEHAEQGMMSEIIVEPTP